MGATMDEFKSMPRASSRKAQSSAVWKKEPRVSFVRLPTRGSTAEMPGSMAAVVAPKVGRALKNERLVKVTYAGGDLQTGLPVQYARMHPRDGQTQNFLFAGHWKPVTSATPAELMLFASYKELTAFPSGHVLAIVDGTDLEGKPRKDFFTATLTHLTPPIAVDSQRKVLKGGTNDHVTAPPIDELKGFAELDGIRLYYSPVADLTPYLDDPEAQVAKDPDESVFARLVPEPDQHADYEKLGLPMLDFSPSKAATGSSTATSHTEGNSLDKVRHKLFESPSNRKRKRSLSSSPSPAPAPAAVLTSSPAGSALPPAPAAVLTSSPAGPALPPVPSATITPSSAASSAASAKEPLHWRPDLSFVTVEFATGSMVDRLVSRFAMPAVPGGKAPEIGDPGFLISAPGEIHEEVYAEMEEVSLDVARQHLAIIHSEVFKPFHVSVSAGIVDAKNDAGTDIVHEASSGGGSSGGTFVNARQVAELLALHQGSASEFPGNNALPVQHNMFRRGYFKYVMPFLDVRALDALRRRLLGDFCAALSDTDRAKLGITQEVADFEARLAEYGT